MELAAASQLLILSKLDHEQLKKKKGLGML